MLSKLYFHSDSTIVLPIHYNAILQAVLYSFINEESCAAFFHDKGYSFEKRNYKLFAFSNICERPQSINRNAKKLVFGNTISFYVSSIDNEFFEYIFNSVLQADGTIRLGSSEVTISSVELIEQDYGDTVLVETLSPITIYSTLFTAEGKKKTYYYSPHEKDFSIQIKNNLIRKYKSLYEKEPVDDTFSIKATGKTREKTSIYKNFIIKGHEGRFELQGSKELLDIALCAGAGSKNSQGFGCLQICSL